MDHRKGEYMRFDAAVFRNLLRMSAGVIRSLAPGGGNVCIYCQRRHAVFLPFGNGAAGLPPLMRALRMIGSDVNRYLCSVCASNDRERHLRLYFEATGQSAGIPGKKILHFAPEHQFTPWLAALGPAEHILADLYPAAPEVRKVDLLSLPFEADHFDFVIVNHVLEHVDDDGKALTEILRVLKPGGVAILQTPYCEGISRKIEDKSVVTDEARLQLYGQEDHVRLYGCDFREFICSHGFEDACATHADVLPDITAEIHGVNPLEPFLRFRKRF